MSIITDIRAELINNAGIAAIVGTRVYWRNPTVAQTEDAYISFSRQTKERDMVRQKDRFQIVCFAKTMSVLDDLSDKVIALFEDKTIVNNHQYFKVYLIAQEDATEKLETGYYWNILTFEFLTTT